MVVFFQYIVNALNLGSLYALAALGIGVVFGVMRLINFAYGDYITLGGFALIWPSTSNRTEMFIGALNWPSVIFGIVGIVILFALLSEVFVFRPLRNADATTLMIASFALSYIIQHLLLMIYGGRAKGVDLWSDLNAPIAVGDLSIPILQIVTTVVTLLLMLILVYFLKRTSLGIEMRAAAENFHMARLLGVRANRVILLAFGISGAIAGIFSLLLMTEGGVINFQLGTPIMLVGFMAVVVGGMGSLAGAAFGGFLIGLLTVLLQALLPLELRPYRDAFVYIAIILMLVFRPQGLIGTDQRSSRV